MAYSNVKKGLITTVVIEKVIQAKRELKLQQSQLYVCMCQAKPRIAVTTTERQKALAHATNVKENRIVLESVRIEQLKGGMRKA